MAARVFVAVDLEGVAAVVNDEEGKPGNPEYERARRLMTGEASAVVAGIFDADPNAEVIIADVHGSCRNIIPEELDERAMLSRGKPRPMGMVHGIDQGFDMAMFVGVHGRAGAGQSTLSHTFTAPILCVQVNGRSVGELGLNAMVAGSFGVPVVLVSGDHSVVVETRELLGSAVVTVEVKRSRGHMVAESLHPNVARTNLRAAAARAVQEGKNVQPLRVSSPIEVEVRVSRPVYADFTELIDDVERIDGLSVHFTRLDMLCVYRTLRLISLFCNINL